MREYGSNINLPSLDNLFSSEQERQDAKLDIQSVPQSLVSMSAFQTEIPLQTKDQICLTTLLH